jgi:hypothetical protein
LPSCKEDRATAVFGRVVDQNQQPVDSIMVMAAGTRALHVERLHSVYTDRDGNYEMMLDVSKRYDALDITLPYLPAENPKFEKSYKISKVFINGKRTTSCCMAIVGKKTQWDYELAPR